MTKGRKVSVKCGEVLHEFLFISVGSLMTQSTRREKTGSFQFIFNCISIKFMGLEWWW